MEIFHGIRSSDPFSRWGGEEFIATIANVDKDKLLQEPSCAKPLNEEGINIVYLSYKQQFSDINHILKLWLRYG